MAREGYHFNRESLSFTQVGQSWGRRIFGWVKYMLAGFGLAVICYLVYSLSFYTPRERQMQDNNRLLADYLKTLQARYDNVSAVLKDLEQRDNTIYRVIFEAEPALDDEQAAAQMIGQMYDQAKREGCEAMQETTKDVLIGLADRAREASASFNDIVELAQADTLFAREVPSIQPLDNSTLTRVAAPFGVRMHPFYKMLRLHTGLDYAAPVGYPVRATANGVVKDVVRSQRGYGNTVIVTHARGYSTLYAHLDEIKVKKGAKVRQGEPLGTVGSTGMCMAPALHYEVHFEGRPVDPVNYFFLELDPLQLARLAKLAGQTGQSMD